MKRSTRALDPIEGFVGPEERWKYLGTAVVKQAVFDWMEAVDRLKHYDTKAMSEQKKSAERFITSSMCELYSGLDGKALLKKLKERVA